MISLENLIISNLQKLLAGSVWKYPQGGSGPISLYQGRLPERGAITAAALDTEEVEHENPFILTRNISRDYTEPIDHYSFFLYAELWDGRYNPDEADYNVNSGRSELERLANILRGLIRSSDYSPWEIEEQMSVQFGDEFGNQSDPQFVALFKINFYKGTESYG